jgi:hypothetical protein
MESRTVKALSDLTDAMIIHIHHLVHEEQRPFSYLDFMKFEVEGREFKMTHGTFRNNVSSLMKEGLVEVSYKSSVTFYTLRGVKFDKASRIALTSNHTGVPFISSASLAPSILTSNPLYRIIRDLPLDKNSVHDIRLRFSSPGIYAIASSTISQNAQGCNCTMNTRSKDILLPTWRIDDVLVKATIHRTDTVSVMMGCSLNPISLDINGLIRLTKTLSVVEERLFRLVEGPQNVYNFTVIGDNTSQIRNRLSGAIPPHSRWLVIMWHFGADALIEYSGERFSIIWETAENVLIRAYSKVMNDNRTRIRLERQEYPKTTVVDIIEQKLSSDRRFSAYV